MNNILVVDDHFTSQRLMSYILQKHQYGVTTATNGREALERLASQHFDLIITDINMPEVNGIELLGFVRSNALYRSIPVIILTGSVQDQHRIFPLDTDINAILTKPIGSDELLATVSQMLSGRIVLQDATNSANPDEMAKMELSSAKMMGLRLKTNVHVL